MSKFLRCPKCGEILARLEGVRPLTRSSHSSEYTLFVFKISVMNDKRGTFIVCDCGHHVEVDESDLTEAAEVAEFVS